jgi:predicted RNA binding protein YcfA (HicA-like mRNA interferase family)
MEQIPIEIIKDSEEGGFTARVPDIPAYGEGFNIIRIHGSHRFLQRGHERTSVPVHGNRNLKIGTLRSILRDIGLSPTEFEKLVSN